MLAPSTLLVRPAPDAGSQSWSAAQPESGIHPTLYPPTLRWCDNCWWWWWLLYTSGVDKTKSSDKRFGNPGAVVDLYRFIPWLGHICTRTSLTGCERFSPHISLLQFYPTLVASICLLVSTWHCGNTCLVKTHSCGLFVTRCVHRTQPLKVDHVVPSIVGNLFFFLSINSRLAVNCEQNLPRMLAFAHFLTLFYHDCQKPINQLTACLK